MLNTLALVTALAGGPAAADTVPATWQVRGDAQGNPVEAMCTVKEQEGALSGSCTMNGTAYPLTGEVKEGTIIFRHPAGEYEGSALTIVYSGTLVAPGEVKGTLLVDPFGVGGAFTATRVASPPAQAPAR